VINTNLGVNTFAKKIISIDEIENIQKNKVLSLVSCIEIKLDGGKIYNFSSFKKRDVAFRLLYAVWKGEPYDNDENLDEDETDLLES